MPLGRFTHMHNPLNLASTIVAQVLDPPRCTRLLFVDVRYMFVARINHLYVHAEARRVT
jgi:hypothetical protein